MAASDVIKLLDSHTNEQVAYFPVTTWADGTDMDDSKVDNVIYRKANNGYYKRVFTNGNVKWFGAKGDGITDDTAALRQAMLTARAINVGMVEVPAGTYLINNLQMVAGISLVGFGGDTYCASNTTNASQNTPNSCTTIFSVASGGQGIICNTDNNIHGGNLENIVIQGCADGTSVFGLKIMDLGWSTKNVSIDFFPTNVGLWIGWHWRATHQKLQIRRCGLAMFCDGSLGPLNGVSFNGLLIENSCIGIYQTSYTGGGFSVSNTFTSATIEGIGNVGGLAAPSWVPVNASVLADMGSTQATFSGAIVLTGNCHFEFIGIYTEAIGGITAYIGLDCTLNFWGGFLSQTNLPSYVWMNGYTGGLTYSRNGSVGIIGTAVEYIDDATVYPSPLFTYTAENNVFLNIRFYKFVGVNTRAIYGNYSIPNIQTSNQRWLNGIFCNNDGSIFGLSVTDIIRSNKYVTSTTTYTNQTGTIDLSTASGFVVFNNTFSNATVNAINLKCDSPGAIIGQRLTLLMSNNLTSGSTITTSFGSNLIGNFSEIATITITGNIVVEFVSNGFSWVLSNIKRASILKYGTTANRPVLGVTDAGFSYFDITIGRGVTWNGTTWLDPTAPATTSSTGVVKKSVALTSPVPANATGAAPTQAEFNAVVAYLNELVTKLQAAGIQS